MDGDSNADLYALNLSTLKWTILDCPSKPKGRDDHSACSSFDKEGLMFIFGGYVDGGKANDMWKFNFETNEWT